MDNVQLLHLHLPKTGGTALWRFFTECLGEKAVTPPQRAIMLREALLQWRQLPVISGHFIAKHGDTIPADRLAITVLRDPVDRFLSDYFYHLLDVDNQLVDAGKRARDLDAHIEHLSQCAADDALVQMEMLYPLGTSAQRRLSTDEKLTAAKAAIDQFALVGIQSEMDDFCSMLCARFQWPLAQARPVNVTSRRIDRDELTPPQRRAIEKLVEPELDLYAHAHSRFRKDRRSFITSGAYAVEPTKQKQEPVNIETTDRLPATQREFGDLRCQIDHIEVQGRVSGPDQVMTGEAMDVIFHITSQEPLEQINAGIAIRDEHGSLMFGTNSLLLGEVYSVTPGRYAIKFSLLNRLGPGVFYIDGALTPTCSHYDGCFHWRDAAARFTVPAHATHHFEGRVLMDVNLDIASVSDSAVWCRKLPLTEGAAARTFGNTSKTLTEFRSSIDIMSSIDVARRESDVLLQVKITNQGTEAWPASGRYPTHLSYRWLTGEGALLVADGLRSDLPGNVAPGDSIVTYMHVRTPETPGFMYLVASLVQEHVAWFVDRDDTNGRALPITIT